jgi:hypothetical protein
VALQDKGPPLVHHFGLLQAYGTNASLWQQVFPLSLLQIGSPGGACAGILHVTATHSGLTSHMDQPKGCEGSPSMGPEGPRRQRE